MIASAPSLREPVVTASLSPVTPRPALSPSLAFLLLPSLSPLSPALEALFRATAGAPQQTAAVTSPGERACGAERMGHLEGAERAFREIER